MSKKNCCKDEGCCCDCGGECKKSFKWLLIIPAVLLIGGTIFGQAGPKKVRKSTFGKKFNFAIAFVWGIVAIVAVALGKKMIKSFFKSKKD